MKERLDEEELKEFDRDTNKKYDKALVPKYLIAYGTDFCAEEILTKYKIIPNSPVLSFGIRSQRISIEKSEECFSKNNYEAKIVKYFYHEYKTYTNPFNHDIPFNCGNDSYEIEGYIDGAIGNSDVKGIFKGRVRIKKLTKE